jgi:tRNA pseudouridine55 synthase
MDGAINLDKPAGPSSAMLVARVKRLLPQKTKIGHAGTLDPFATGVLVLLIGKATRWCETLMDQPKQYEATVKLGATTATDDLESEATPHEVKTEPTLQDVQRAVAKLVGTILQRPPAFSAIKVGGRRAYDLSRKGKPPELAARPVRVDAIEVLHYHWPLVRLRIDCGRGTYIRSIARDLGEDLRVGGYLTELRRTRVGQFVAENAVTIEKLTADGVELHLTLRDANLR